MSEALRLANVLENEITPEGIEAEAAAELRRLHAENEALRIERANLRIEVLRLKSDRAELVEALQLALSSYGVMMMGNPPQEAWDVWKVDEKARAALAKTTTQGEMK